MKKVHKSCFHCGPLPVNHLANWLNDLLSHITRQLEKKLFYSAAGKKRFFLRRGISFSFFTPAPILVRGFIWLLQKIKIISFKTEVERSKVYNRTLVLLDEAQKRGIKTGAVLFLGRYNNQFFAEVNGRKIFFEGLPLGRRSIKAANLFIDDKAEIKKILRQNNLPFVEGKYFWSGKKAYEYGLTLGFPLVVKPRWGSVSRHVFLNINDELALVKAIEAVKKICPAFIVEKYLAGAEVYRATLVNFELGGVVKRLPANIVGDGRRTITQLVAAKNSHPWRGQPKQKNATYLKIVIDETTQKLLSQQGFSLDSVPAANQRVFLQEKIILDLGADLIEVSGQVHSDNRALFEEVAEIFDAGVLGIDFLCQDIGASWKGQKCAIMELNSLPFIDMHHFPLEGEPRNLAGMIWEMVLNNNQQPTTNN